jgi:hypothetical protein
MTKTEATWANRVQAWRESDKSAEAFVEGQGYRATTLRWYASRLRQSQSTRLPKRESARAEPTGAVVLARVVRVTAPARATIAITIGDARLDVSTGFEPALLRAVVACLGAAS